MEREHGPSIGTSIPEFATRLQATTKSSGLDRRAFVKAGLAFLAAPMVLEACGGSGGNSAQTTNPSVVPSVSEMESRARAEGGSLLYYAGGAGSTVTPIKLFRKAYPWANVSTVLTTTDGITTRVLQEASAKAPTADVVSVSLPQGSLFAQAKAIAPSPLPNDKLLPKSVADPRGYVHYIFQNIVVLIYNTHLLKSPPSKDLYDLASSRWRNHIVFDSPSGLNAAAYVLASHRSAWGNDKWTTWLKALQSNNVFITTSATASYNTVLSGERAIGIGQLDDVLSQKPGAPVAPVFFDGIPPNYMGLARPTGSKHPYLADLFMNWSMSNAGQLAMASTGRQPILNVDSPYSISRVLPKGTTIEPITSIESYINNPDSYVEIWNEYWPS